MLETMIFFLAGGLLLYPLMAVLCMLAIVVWHASAAVREVLADFLRQHRRRPPMAVRRR